MGNTVRPKTNLVDDLTDETAATTEHDAPAWEGGYTLANILAMELQPPRWAIQELVAEGLTILAGPAKVGKSWLSLDMCLAVASGGSVLGYQAERGEALYLALEDKPFRMKDRAQKMLADSAPSMDHLHIYFDWPRFDSRGDGMARLEQTLKAHPELRLVVIDTYAKVKAPLYNNKNQYEQEYWDANRLKTLAEECKLAIVVVTHTTKLRADADPFLEISGSVGLTGAMDNGIVLRYTGGAGPNGSKGKEVYVRGRDVMDTTFPVLFDDTTMRCQRAEDDLFGHLTPDQRRTAQVLYDEVDVTPQHLAEILGGGMTADAAQLRLKKLVSLGVAERLGQGHYTLTDEYLRTDGTVAA